MVSDAKQTKIADGVRAWAKGHNYHSCSLSAQAKLNPVYHKNQYCKAGLSIRVRHLRKGKDGRDPCQDC